MVNIQETNKSQLIIEDKNKDRVSIIVKNEYLDEVSMEIQEFIKKTSDNERLFISKISQKQIDLTTTELNVEFLFDTQFVNLIYQDLKAEISNNSIRIEQMEKCDKLTPNMQEIFDKRIDLLTDRNEELMKQQRIVQMQLFNEIDKKEKLLNKINEFIKNNLEKYELTYSIIIPQIEESIMDLYKIYRMSYEI